MARIEYEYMYCKKCGRRKRETEFFKMKDGSRVDLCKDCITMNIDNYKPETFMWILEKFDVPYVEPVWIQTANAMRAKNPMKFGPKSVIGMYLRKMNMSQYSDKRFADTEELAAEAEKEEQDRLARVESFKEERDSIQEQYEKGEISEGEYLTLISAPEPEPAADLAIESIARNGLDEGKIKDELGEEDFQYLLLKWGTFYKPSELVKMEELYQKYESENELNTDREETLRKICKTSLKMDQALDAGDVLNYKSLSQVFDQLRKSAKFTEAQNKEEVVREIDSIGELVAFVEREGGVIPQKYDPIEYPQDKVDFTINNIKNYVVNLVKNELGLGDIIESFIDKLNDTQRVKSAEEILHTTEYDDPLEKPLTPEEEIEFQMFKLQEIEEESARLAEEFAAEELEVNRDVVEELIADWGEEEETN